MQPKTITERPARVAGEISRRLATQERRAEKTRQRVRKLREKASAEIERLIAFMDATDDYSMDEREPSLGLTENHPCNYDTGGGYWFRYTSHNDGSQAYPQGNSDDREDEHDGREPEFDEEDGGDDEPSLGSPEYHPAGYCMMGGEANQERWAQGRSDETERDDADDPKGELVNEDGDGNPDDEPSLGWCEPVGFGGAGMGGWDDREQGAGWVRPQNRTDLCTTLSLEQSYRKFIRGLTDGQRKTFRERMRDDSGVCLR